MKAALATTSGVAFLATCDAVTEPSNVVVYEGSNISANPYLCPKRFDAASACTSGENSLCIVVAESFTRDWYRERRSHYVRITQAQKIDHKTISVTITDVDSLPPEHHEVVRVAKKVRALDVPENSPSRTENIRQWPMFIGNGEPISSESDHLIVEATSGSPK